MRKRKCLALALALLSLAILGFTPEGYHVGLANSLSSASQNVPTLGTMHYATFNTTNLALIPDDWGLAYGSGPQIIFLDTSVEHTAGKPSIRLEPHTAADVNTGRECDGTWYPAKGGDHIVAKCWMKIDSNPSALGRGARIGLDFYGANGYITGVSGAHGINPQPDADVQANFVHWGTAGWSQRTIDFILASTYASDVDGTTQTVTSIVMWMQVECPPDAGSGWFADAELYINPT
jgi:hypothetical protein